MADINNVVSSVDKLDSCCSFVGSQYRFSEVSSVAKSVSSAVSSVEKNGPPTMRTVLPSVGEFVRHVPVIAYVSDIVLVVISCDKMNVPATTF